MNENNISHCPFCGGDAEIQTDGTTYQICYVYCECKSCGSRGKAVAFGFVWKNFEMAKKEAIEHWSKRKPIDNIIKRLKEVGKLEISSHSGRCNGKTLTLGHVKGIENAIEIVKEEGQINE